jgi:hypothetical protein
MNLNKILNAVKKVKNFEGKNPSFRVDGEVIIVSAEDGNYFADYYCEFNNDDPYIHPKLEKIADKYGLYWEWEHAGAISLYVG